MLQMWSGLPTHGLIMEHISSMFAHLEKAGKPATRPLTKRGELIKYFHDRARGRDGKPFEARYIAIRLSHLSLFDLSAFKSDLEDRKRRFDGRKARGELMPVEAQDKVFNWSRAFFAAIKPRD